MKKTKLLTVVDDMEGGWVKKTKLLTVVDVGGREGGSPYAWVLT